MKSLCFNTTSHQYLMWANRTDPAAGRLMIGRLFQKNLERSDGSEHTRVQIKHFVMKLVSFSRWSGNRTSCCSLSLFVSETFSWWSLSSVKILDTEPGSRTTRRVNAQQSPFVSYFTFSLFQTTAMINKLLWACRRVRLLAAVQLRLCQHVCKADEEINEHKKLKSQKSQTMQSEITAAEEVTKILDSGRSSLENTNNKQKKLKSQKSPTKETKTKNILHLKSDFSQRTEVLATKCFFKCFKIKLLQ